MRRRSAPDPRPARGAATIAVATAVAVLGLLVGLSVAARVQPSDTFQATPRAAKQQVQGVDAPGRPNADVTPHVRWPDAVGGILAVVPSIAGPGVDVWCHGTVAAATPARTARRAHASGCRGPPLVAPL